MKTMKNILISAAFATFILFAISCKSGSSSSAEQTSTEQLTAVGEYACPMHPEVQSDKPGSCRICGMELVKKDTPPAADTIKLEPDSLLAL
jgi:membrane fusion protein, copper/silver efflux system